MFMAIGAGVAASPLFLPQLGFAFVDLSTAVVISWPAVGTGVKVSLPSTLPVGTAILLQGAAGTNGWGNLSNPLDVRVRL